VVILVIFPGKHGEELTLVVRMMNYDLGPAESFPGCRAEYLGLAANRTLNQCIQAGCALHNGRY
jgi:hypothetical protein